MDELKNGLKKFFEIFNINEVFGIIGAGIKEEISGSFIGRMLGLAERATKAMNNSAAAQVGGATENIKTSLDGIVEGGVAAAKRAAAQTAGIKLDDAPAGSTPPPAATPAGAKPKAGNVQTYPH